MKKRTRLIVTALVIFYILCGFFREYVFTNINEQCRVSYYHENDSHVSSSMRWLEHFSYAQLYYSKWILTLLFSVYFALLAGITIKIAFDDPAKKKITWLVFGIIFTLSLLIYAAGAVAGKSYVTYDVSRFLAGLIETPAMLIILLAAFTIRRQA